MRCLVVSDMHVGSNVSIMPPEVTVDEGAKKRRITSNAIQKYIYSKWEDMVDSVGKVDACIVLGDSIEGPNYKSRG